jgi:hypothetical protein
MIDQVNVKGFSTIRAWPKGLLPEIMAGGLALPEAIKIAKTKRLCKYENQAHNLFVSTGKYLLLDFLIGESRTGLTYHALGTYDTAPAPGDTALVMEASRNTISSKYRSGTNMVLSTFFTAALSTFYIKECGVFGNGATSTPSSGTMFCRYLQDFDNRDGLNDLTFEYVFGL